MPRILTAIILAAAMCCACVRHSSQWPALLRADAAMEQRPDLSLAMLRAVDTLALARGEEKALYALLLNQALVKCDTAMLSDTLARAAVAYYEGKPASHELMRALYYLGDAQNNLGDNAAAMQSLLRANDIALARGDIYWQAKAAEIMSDVYSQTYHASQWSDMAKKSADLYKRAGRELNHRYLMVDYGASLAPNGRPEAGLAIIDSIKSVALAECDTALAVYALKAQLPLVVNTENAIIKDVIDDVASLSDAYQLECYDYIMLGKAYLLFGDFEAAERMLDIAEALNPEANERAMLLSVQASYALNKRDVTLSNRYLMALVDFINGEVSSAMKESAVVTQRDYFSEKAEREKERSSMLTIVMALVMTISVVIVAFLWIIHALRMREKANELDNKILSIQDLAKALNESKRHNAALSESINASAEEMILLKGDLKMAIRERWELLNALCTQYFEHGSGSERTKAVIIKEIEREVSKLKSPESLLKIEALVNNENGGIIDMLRSECPCLSPDDISIFTLILAGFSPRAICLLRDIKYKTFYTKRSRMIEKIIVCDPPHKGLFIERMR